MPSAERPRLALAIPAYEEDGLDGFLLELDKHLAPVVETVEFFVVDDASSGSMPAQLDAVAAGLGGRLHVVRNETNRGHGPTVLRAYQLALASGADIVFQVDGDGQFAGEDAVLLLDALAGDGDVAVGTRRSRVDPWFRRALSRALQLFLRTVYGVSSTDPNCPFRAFPRETLAALLAVIPDDAMIPNVYLTILAGRRRDLQVVEVPVRHRPRRGTNPKGTLIPRRLITFVTKALLEALRLTPTLLRKAPDETP